MYYVSSRVRIRGAQRRGYGARKTGSPRRSPGPLRTCARARPLARQSREQPRQRPQKARSHRRSARLLRAGAPLGSGRALPNLAAVLAEAGRFTDVDALAATVDPAREADVWSAVSHATASFTESAAELKRARASTPEAFSNEAFRPCSSASSCARVGDEVLVSRDTRCLRVPGRSIVDGCELSHSSSSGC